MELVDLYNNIIKDRYNDLIFSGKEIDNYDLAKIFEYYSCVQLSKKYNNNYYRQIPMLSTLYLTSGKFVL